MYILENKIKDANRIERPMRKGVKRTALADGRHGRLLDLSEQGLQRHKYKIHLQRRQRVVES